MKLRPLAVAAAVSFLGLALGPLGEGRALADDGQQRKKEEAATRFDRGIKLFDAADYGAALAEFQAAYRLTSFYVLEKNIGVAQKKLFRYNDAVNSLNAYLRDGGDKLDPAQRAEVEGELAEIRKLVAEVAVQVEGAPADLDLDGRAVGKTPLEGPLLVASGHHLLRATRTGDEPAQKEFDAISGERVEVTLAPQPLPRLPTTAKLTVSSLPHGAELTVDGRFAGKEPWSGTLDPGGHEVSATLAGYEKSRTELVLVAGQERNLEIELQLPVNKSVTPITQTTAFKAVIGVLAGVLVVGGAVGGGVAGYIATHPNADFDVSYP